MVQIKYMQYLKTNQILINPTRYLLIACWVLLGNTLFCQNNTDSVVKKNQYNFIVGFNLNPDRDYPTAKICSNIGIEYVFKNKKHSLSYSNFFNTQPYAKLPYQHIRQKHLLALTSINNFDVNFTKTFSNNTYYIKYGAGIFLARRQGGLDQLFFFRVPHEQGINLFIYSKLKWLNVGLRKEIRLFSNYNGIDIDVLPVYLYHICIEIPIKIK